MTALDLLPELVVGTVVEATIERLVPGGLGLGHVSGHTILVPLTAPGDTIRARIERIKGRVAFGSVVDVTTASPVRVDPPCPFYGWCGGCDFQHLSYEAQLTAKVDFVRDCLRRIGQIEPPETIPITPSPSPWAYRTRAEWQHAADAGILGYFERDSHRICDVTGCLVLVPLLEEELRRLRSLVGNRSVPPHVHEFRAVAGDEGVTVTAAGASGNRTLSCTVGAETYWFDADCFFQANHGILTPLVDEALRFAPELNDDRATHDALAVDLYCGVGLFTLPLARRFSRVVGVESHRHAVEFAVLNAGRAGLANVSIARLPVEQWLVRQAKTSERAAYLVLDPPRGGVEPAALAALLRVRPDRIAYVSCDPATLARDLKRLLTGGFDLQSVAAFDMFPQTHHVEIVAHLVLGPRPVKRRRKPQT